MKTAICKLCDQPKKLHKSHIVPEFCYETLYNDKHKFIQLSTNPDDRTISRPKGLYDHLLCGDCEARVKVFEDYFVEILNWRKRLHYLDFSHTYYVISRKFTIACNALMKSKTIRKLLVFLLGEKF